MKISIITVVRNNVNCITNCIKSVLAQTYKDIEYILVDGQSTDGTLEIINRYKEDIAKLISEKDQGHIFAMNKGLRLATGDIIGFLHSDDVYADSDVVKNVVDVFKKKGTDCVYGDLVYIRRKNTNRILRYWRAGDGNVAKIANGWMPPHPSLFIKRGIYEKYGYFNSTDFKISMDYELMLRFLYRHRISMAYLPKVLVKMRMGGISNKGLGNLVRKTLEDYRACRAHEIRGSAITIIRKNIAKIPQFFVR